MRSFSEGAANALQNSGAKVEVYKGNSATPAATFTVPNKAGTYWIVFVYDGATGNITAVSKSSVNDKDMRP